MSLSRSLQTVKFLCLASGAVTASGRKVWNFGRVVNIVCMIASCIRGKMTIGQSIDWRHKPNQSA
ncbi:Uncharacterised protein [Vibrio cholerae]|uniref:Uncharacterized protein n=1 Tax=Vibrio cholerae TaxID=666 RepID=A0A655WW95_VIBCL|nr:Uncharacterised protein [Vibrio cholerae]